MVNIGMGNKWLLIFYFNNILIFYNYESLIWFNYVKF